MGEYRNVSKCKKATVKNEPRKPKDNVNGNKWCDNANRQVHTALETIKSSESQPPEWDFRGDGRTNTTSANDIDVDQKIISKGSGGIDEESPSAGEDRKAKAALGKARHTHEKRH